MKTATVTPSQEARTLFGRMVARSPEGDHLSLPACLELGVELKKEGKDPLALEELRELELAYWVEPAGDGGWFLGEGFPVFD
jgi:hypothetical protein